MLPNTIKIIKMRDVQPHQIFRFRKKFWEFSINKQVAWPYIGSVADRIFIFQHEHLLDRNVAVLK